MTHAARLLVENIALIESLSPKPSVLDLASGSGRNGLYLAGKGLDVVFADKDAAALSSIETDLAKSSLNGKTLQVDLEQADSRPLEDLQFDICLVFNYLHRPLFEQIRNGVSAGGLIFYETFTTANRKFGRPRNSDFLLRESELMSYFSHWEVLHYFEGELAQPERAVAQIIARKP